MSTLTRKPGEGCHDENPIPAPGKGPTGYVQFPTGVGHDTVDDFARGFGGGTVSVADLHRALDGLRAL